MVKALPEHGFANKGASCHGSKKSKERMTVAFLVNAAGGKETTTVAWKSAKPRCFKSIDINNLPVSYFSQPKAWMTGDILGSVLTKLNIMLDATQKILLKIALSNIKFIFLPPYTTSKLLSLDLGIIKISRVPSQIDACDKASEVTKSVRILHCIRWVVQA